MKKGVNLRKWLSVVGKEKLQTFQDYFASQNNVALTLLDIEGQELMVPAKGCLLCHELKERRKTPCQREHAVAEKTVMEDGHIQFFTCSLGLSYFLCPLFSNDELVGFGYGGCVACENSPIPQETREKYKVTTMDKQQLMQIGKSYESIAALLNVDYKKLYMHEKETESSPLKVQDPRLTEREAQVADLICQGYANKQISEQLYISEKTVKSHVSNILNKLNVKDRTQIVVFYSGGNTVKR